MKKRFVLIFAMALVISQVLSIDNRRVLAHSEVASGRQPIPRSFFGMTTHAVKPWPMLQFGGVRLWTTHTNWASINPSNGVYNWTTLDKWLATIQQHGTKQTIYTLAMTPQWASSKPNDQTCRFGPGACDPPDDLNPDGSGTDQHWKDFVAAIATHAAGRIRYWEIWNEPVNLFYWTGTFAQMVRMAQDARNVILAIDPTARLLSPPNGANIPFGEKWWEGYAALGGLNSADVIALHGYVALPPHQCGNFPKASDFITEVDNLRAILAKYGAQNKPIFDTESSWWQANVLCFTNPDLQAAFLAQFYMFHASMGIKRLYWFAYNDPTTGQLYDAKTKQLTRAGAANGQVYNWMIGNTMTQDCSLSGKTVWSCGLSGPNGYLAKAIWNTAETCHKGHCQTAEYKVSSTYTQFRTLDGKTIPIKNNHVPIGAKPILLENHSR